MSQNSQRQHGQGQPGPNGSFYRRSGRVRPRLPKPPSQNGPGADGDKTTTNTGDILLRVARAYRHNRYVYKRIPEDTTRLLIVEPRKDQNDDIYVQLVEVPFADLGTRWEYEALSYHWGSEEASRPLHIRNEGDLSSDRPYASLAEAVDAAENILLCKQLWVKRSLYIALSHLRMNEGNLVLWADAICIDQEHYEEKQRQVARMAEIYSRASCVLIWLGPSDARTKSAMSFILEVIDLENLKPLVSNENAVSRWRDLMHLMRSSWFSRRWVIQELALSRDATVHCGDEQIHWLDFRDAISLFAHNFDEIRTLFRRSEEFDSDFNAIGELESFPAKVMVDTTNNIFRKHESTSMPEAIQGLEWLVSSLSAFETADPRDTVYGLRNIAKETVEFRQREKYAIAEPPTPDYEKDLLRVYTDFLKWVVSTFGSIDILCRHWALPEKAKPDALYPSLVTLPSWIQSISEAPFGKRSSGGRGRINGDSFVGLPGNGSYNASYGLTAVVKFPPEIQSPVLKHTLVNKEPRPNKQGGAQTTPSRRADANATTPQLRPQDDIRISEPHNGVKQESTDAELSTQTGEKAMNGGLDLSNSIVELSLPTERATRDESRRSNPPARSPSHTGADAPYKSAWQRLFKTGLQPEASAADSSRRSSTSFVAPPNMPAEAEALKEWRLLNQHLGGRDSSIQIDGLEIGVVGWTTDPIPDGVIPSAALARLRGDGDELVPDKLWRTLVAERGANGHENPPAWYYRACCHCMANDSPNGHINTRELLAKRQPDIIRALLKRVQAVIWNRRFLEISRRGSGASGGSKSPLHGFGPASAQAGDLLCVLYGCSVPVLLRRRAHPTIGEYFTFLGEAYIYGIMDGEAVSSMKKSEIKDNTVTFRLL